MIYLYLVYRKYGGSDESMIGAFLIKRHAESFMAECARLSASSGAKLRIEESCIRTYGMAEETRRHLIDAIAPILESAQ